jgi:hypothetical protein
MERIRRCFKECALTLQHDLNRARHVQRILGRVKRARPGALLWCARDEVRSRHDV